MAQMKELVFVSNIVAMVAVAASVSLVRTMKAVVVIARWGSH